MTTAADRLRALSGPGGTSAAARLRRIGLAGATAAALLVAYSGLPSATAAEHLLAEHAQQQASGGATTYYGKGKAALDLEHQDRVRAHWDEIEALRQAAAAGGADRDSSARSPAAGASQAAQSRPADQPGAGIPEPASASQAPVDAYALGARTEEEAALLLAVLQLSEPAAARGPAADEDLALALLLAAEAAQASPSMAA